MNFIQTLYIDPDKDPFHDSFGWAAPEYHLMGGRSVACYCIIFIEYRKEEIINRKERKGFTQRTQCRKEEIFNRKERKGFTQRTQCRKEEIINRKERKGFTQRTQCRKIKWFYNGTIQEEDRILYHEYENDTPLTKSKYV